jgi:hypothetical protein
MDEFNVRQLLLRDSVESLERGTDKDKGVPLPSMGKTEVSFLSCHLLQFPHSYRLLYLQHFKVGLDRTFL